MSSKGPAKCANAPKRTNASKYSKYFEYVGKDNANCLLCPKEVGHTVMTKDGSTAGKKSHLQAAHKLEYAAIIIEE